MASEPTKKTRCAALKPQDGRRYEQPECESANCPAGCGHDVDRHYASRVAFNHAMPCNEGKKDYDAMSCGVVLGPLGKPVECKCVVEQKRWEELIAHDETQGSLFDDGID